MVFVITEIVFAHDQKHVHGHYSSIGQNALQNHTLVLSKMPIQWNPF